jgi:hypothetical protein
MLKEIHRRYPMATVSLTKEGPRAAAGGGEGRVRGEKSVIVALAVSESREGPIEGHALGHGTRAQSRPEGNENWFGVGPSYSRNRMDAAHLGSK